jgi:hypothetical protein
VFVPLDGEAQRTAEAAKFGEAHVSQLGCSESEIAEAERQVAVGVDFG